MAKGMKYNNLNELSTHDKEIRTAAEKLAVRYKIPVHTADDFVSEGYLKVQKTYFDYGGYCTVGGIIQVINCLMLDHLKHSTTKQTFNGIQSEPYLDIRFYEETDYEKEEQLLNRYNEQISLIRNLPQTHIEIIYALANHKIEEVSDQMGISIVRLKNLKKGIYKKLRINSLII